MRHTACLFKKSRALFLLTFASFDSFSTAGSAFQNPFWAVINLFHHMLFQFTKKNNEFLGFQSCSYRLIRNQSCCCHPCNDKQQLSVLLIRRWRIIITQFWFRRKRIRVLDGDVIVLFHSLFNIIKSLLCVMFFLHLLFNKIQSLHSL